MSTWHKVGCCLIAAVAAFGAVADNPWQGKNVAFLGDGLTAAAENAPRYWSVLQTNLGLTPWVYASAGATMAQIKSQAEALKAEHATGVDGIVVLAGLEDYAADCPLGSWYSVDAQTSQRQFALDANTFRGRINLAFDYLKDNFPEAEIILLTPIHRNYASTAQGGELPDESFGNPSDLHLDDYVQVLKEASGVWSVPLVDLYGECGLFASPDEEQARIAATLTYALVRRPGVILTAMASPMDIDDAGDASVWINGDTSSAQDWQVPENWQDGKVPAAGADVIVKASAYINFAGADLGSITHEDGVLQIDSSGTQMTLRGDFTSTGANVTLNNTPIALTSGEHVFTVAGAFQHDIASVFSGTDVVFVKKGVGTFGVTLGGAAVYTYTGEFRLLEGTLITGSTNSSCWQNYLFSGISKFTLAGTLSMYNYYKLNKDVELVVLEGGKITWTGNYGSYGFTMTVKKASYLGMPCAAGNWGSSAAGSGARLAPFISTGNDKARLIVSECESDVSCYTGRGGFDSANACHWTGAVSADWTDEANWKDGKVPTDGNDVFIDATAACTPDPATVPALVVRDFIDQKPGSHAICGDKGLTVSGCLNLASGSKKCSCALTLSAGVHLYEGDGTLKLIEQTVKGDGELKIVGHGEVVENAPATTGGQTCVWINGDTSSAQDWKVAANWQDGKVPNEGDDVVVNASANINFGGADLGSIRQTTGALTIDSGKASLLLGGDLIATGSGVTIKNTPIVLSDGRHVVSNTCAVTHDASTSFSGYDIVFVKKGTGSFGCDGRPSANIYSFTGELQVLEGSFTTGSGSVVNDYLFSGLTKCTIAGTINIHGSKILNAGLELYIVGDGKITWSGNYASYSYSSTVKKLFYRGMPCAAGAWGSSAAGSGARIAPFISTGNDKARLNVTECETDACYTGRGGYESDYACHWTGAASTDWTDVANWKDGKVPQDGWDVFIDATASRTPDPATVPALVIRDLVDKKSGSHAICGDKGLIVSGSIYLASGSKSCGSALTLTDGMHFFDGEGSLKLIEHEIEGDGELVNLGSGQIVENAEDTSGGKTRVWINDDTSAAQDWKVPANWQDGKVPNPGDNVIIGVSAKINFGGAELASIIQTNGTLTIDSGKVSMILGKDIVATGSGMTINNTPIKLAAGDHVISNTCAFAHDAATTWSSDEDFVRLLKYGKGSFTGGGGSKTYTFAGSIELYGGTVQLDGDYQNVAVSGPTNILVSGHNTVLKLYNFDNLNHNATLRFENGAQIQWSGNYTSVQFDCTVKRMFIDGQQCVAGNWGPFNSSYPHKMIQIYSTVNANVRIAVTEGPAEGGFEGLSVMWSGNVKHWTGAVNNSWSTAGNWEEGEVPRLLDDIVIGVDVTRMPNNDWGTLAHHSVYIDTTNAVTVGNPKAIYGDLHVAKGKKTHGWTTYSFPKGEHIIDIDEGGNLYLFNASVFSGAGNLIKTGKGMIQAGMGNPWTSTGSLTVKDGTIDLISGAKIESITNVVLKETGKLILRGANLSTDATVRVDSPAMLQLAGTFSNDIKHLVLDGKDRSPRTYGGLKSNAEKKLSKYFTGGTSDKGILNVTEGHVDGFMLLVK